MEGAAESGRDDDTARDVGERAGGAGRLCVAMVLLGFAGLAGPWSCKSGGFSPEQEESSAAQTGDQHTANPTTNGNGTFDWTSREQQWLEGESRDDFRALMNNLREEAPLSEDKSSALRRKLRDWPAEARIVPEAWVDQLVAGSPVELAEFARTLEATRSGLGDEGVRALAGSESLSGLTILDLVWNDIGDDGARALADSEPLSGLTRLQLGSNDIGDDGAEALAGSESLSGLTHLDLGRNDIGDDGAEALEGSPHLSCSAISHRRIDCSDP